MLLLQLLFKYKHSTDNCGGWNCGLPAALCKCYK